MNMKVAGTIGPYLKKKAKQPGSDDSPDKNDTTSVIDSECQSSNTTDVWDKSLFEGLTSKQKKNLRKKLQRQRKNKKKTNEESSQMESSLVDGSVKDISDIDN